VRNLVFAALAIVVAGGAFFFFGRNGGMSEAELIDALAERAAQINSADGERFDDFSELVSATAVERQITVRGETFLDAEAVPEDYLENRRIQTARILCEGEQSRAMMEAGATHVFNWWTADDVSIGMVTLRGDAVCGELGF